MSLERHDVRYIVERGGGYPELLDKHVAVVGCGAVGSVVAEQLARAGVGSLTLIDDDIFSRDNLHRHSLNLGDVQRPKVDALKGHLCKSYPYLEAAAWRRRIEMLLEAKVLQKFDLLVLATGDQTVELKVSQFVHEELEGLALLHTWLEPMGLGGHALLSHVTLDNHGCFECLFQDREDGLGFYNRASFAAPEQSFARSISGCAVNFVPYGALHATRTACLAVGMALDFLRGRQANHELRSWKGDARDFIEAGYITSERYDLSQDGLDERRCQFFHPSCQRCSG